MSERPLSNQERAALAKRELSLRKRWHAFWVFAIGLALLLAVVAALTFTGHAALALSTWGQTITAVYAVTLLVYFIAMMSRSYVPSVETDDPRFLRRRIDEYQRRWRWTILGQIFLTAPCFAYLPLMFLVFGSAPFMRAVVVFIIFALIIILVFLLLAGPGLQGTSLGLTPDLLNDEFITALRARMMRFAYILTMLLLGTVLVIDLWRPDLTLRALCWALYASFALPALYYVIADWRAASAGENRDG